MTGFEGVCLILGMVTALGFLVASPYGGRGYMLFAFVPGGLVVAALTSLVLRGLSA